MVPARGGSKGIPRKNIRPLCGKPLIVWTLEAARAASGIGRLIVSTDDDEIASISRAHGAEVLVRPASLSQDHTPTLDVLQHAVALLAAQKYSPDCVATLQPTSPLRTSQHIIEALELFRADPDADSLVSCVPVPHHFHPLSVMQANDRGYLEPFVVQTAPPTRRQDKSLVLARNGAAIYLTRTRRLTEYVFGGNLLAYQMDPRDSVDIDSDDDFLAAEAALQRRHEIHGLG